jgi:hypothetical protein
MSGHGNERATSKHFYEMQLVSMAVNFFGKHGYNCALDSHVHEQAWRNNGNVCAESSVVMNMPMVGMVMSVPQVCGIERSASKIITNIPRFSLFTMTAQ